MRRSCRGAMATPSRLWSAGSVLSGGTDTVVLERVKPKPEAKKKK